MDCPHKEVSIQLIGTEPLLESKRCGYLERSNLIHTKATSDSIEWDRAYDYRETRTHLNVKSNPASWTYKARRRALENTTKNQWTKLLDWAGRDETRVYLHRRNLRKILRNLQIKLSDREFRELWCCLSESVPGYAKKLVPLDRLEDAIQPEHSLEIGSIEDGFLGYVSKALRRGLHPGEIFATLFPVEGYIDLDDLASAIQSCGCKAPRTLARQYFSEIDIGRKGQLHYDDFLVWLNKLKLLPRNEEVISTKNVNKEPLTYDGYAYRDLSWKGYNLRAKSDRRAAVQGILLFIVRQAFARERNLARHKSFKSLIRAFPPVLHESLVVRSLKQKGITFSSDHMKIFIAAFEPSVGNEINSRNWLQLIYDRPEKLSQLKKLHSNPFNGLQKNALWALKNSYASDQSQNDNAEAESDTSSISSIRSISSSSSSSSSRSSSSSSSSSSNRSINTPPDKSRNNTQTRLDFDTCIEAFPHLRNSARWNFQAQDENDENEAIGRQISTYLHLSENQDDGSHKNYQLRRNRDKADEREDHTLMNNKVEKALDSNGLPWETSVGMYAQERLYHGKTVFVAEDSRVYIPSHYRGHPPRCLGRWAKLKIEEDGKAEENDADDDIWTVISDSSEDRSDSEIGSGDDVIQKANVIHYQGLDKRDPNIAFSTESSDDDCDSVQSESYLRLSISIVPPQVKDLGFEVVSTSDQDSMPRSRSLSSSMSARLTRNSRATLKPSSSQSSSTSSARLRKKTMSSNLRMTNSNLFWRVSAYPWDLGTHESKHWSVFASHTSTTCKKANSLNTRPKQNPNRDQSLNTIHSGKLSGAEAPGLVLQIPTQRSLTLTEIRRHAKHGKIAAPHLIVELVQRTGYMGRRTSLKCLGSDCIPLGALLSGNKSCKRVEALHLVSLRPRLEFHAIVQATWED